MGGMAVQLLSMKMAGWSLRRVTCALPQLPHPDCPALEDLELHSSLGSFVDLRKK